MANAMGLIFLPFNIASAQQVHFGIPQYVQCMLLYILCMLVVQLRSSVATVSTHALSTYFIHTDFCLSAPSHKADKRVGSFLRSLSSRLISAKHYGHVDLFVPLTTSGISIDM